MSEVIREAYEDWCARNRKRKSEAGWELWMAAWTTAWSHSQLPGFEYLSEQRQDYIAALVRAFAEGDDTMKPSR